METSSRVTPLRLDREDEKKMLPCRFFANGYCHKGNRCRFFHPLNVGLNSMIRVPPLPPYFGGSSHEMRHSPQQPQQQQNNAFANHIDWSEFPAQSPPPHFGGPPPPRETMRHTQQQQQQQPPTVFSHIDWSEFLAPGQKPPPPTIVPDESHSPSRKSDMCLGTGKLSSEPPSSSSSNEDMPPEGRVSQRKLTAKEELHMKVQEIAKELAEEPLAPIHSLDSFFRNFSFTQ